MVMCSCQNPNECITCTHARSAELEKEAALHREQLAQEFQERNQAIAELEKERDRLKDWVDRMSHAFCWNVECEHSAHLLDLLYKHDCGRGCETTNPWAPCTRHERDALQQMIDRLRDKLSRVEFTTQELNVQKIVQDALDLKPEDFKEGE